MFGKRTSNNLHETDVTRARVRGCIIKASNQPAAMRFEFEEDVKGTAADNNGHVVHQITLHVPGGTDSPFYSDSVEGDGEAADDEVGYIKATYITSEVWRERYTGDWGLLHWGSDFHGWCGFQDPLGEDEFYDFPHVVKSLSKKAMSQSDWLSKTDVEEMCQSELEERFEFYMVKLHKRFDEERKRTKEFHVDKPRVEFIRVAKDHQRQGYGTALYKRMTEELGRRYGLSLYASQLQRDPAEAAWEKLVTLDWNDAEEEEMPFEGDNSTRYKLSLAKTSA